MLKLFLNREFQSLALEQARYCLLTDVAEAMVGGCALHCNDSDDSNSSTRSNSRNSSDSSNSSNSTNNSNSRNNSKTVNKVSLVKIRITTQRM